MSLTSYRTAPPRGTFFYASSAGADICRLGFPCLSSGGRSALRSAAHFDGAFLAGTKARDEKAAARETRQRLFEIVNGFVPRPSAIMPGGDLLSQCLSTSTIGAVRFHVRVRDGIGWVTDAIATKQ